MQGHNLCVHPNLSSSIDLFYVSVFISFFGFFSLHEATLRALELVFFLSAYFFFFTFVSGLQQCLLSVRVPFIAWKDSSLKSHDVCWE